MQPTSAVVLVIDGLGTGWLGPYGNSWLDTPACNRLAAQSVLCETVLADSVALDVAYRSLWTGRHAIEPASDADIALPIVAAANNICTTLLTDDSSIAQHAAAAGFHQRRVLPAKNAARCSERIEDTGLFSTFDAARATIADQQSPFFLWFHARGMHAPWDAPLELRYQFADEEDPAPPSLVYPPNLRLPGNFDPDELRGYVQAYAGQVALADMCLGMLLEALDEHPLAGETLLVVTSPRGYPLGEHARVGPCDHALYGELLSVPLLVRFPGGHDFPGGDHALARSRLVLQPNELYAIISAACGWQASSQRDSTLLNELTGDNSQTNGLACAFADGQRAIRTPAWFLRQSLADGETRHELFAKPDDRWEANEVSSRGGDIVELLAAELDRFEQAARGGRLGELGNVPQPLGELWR
jgi:arylsulfatase A-like enzyme